MGRHEELGGQTPEAEWARHWLKTYLGAGTSSIVLRAKPLLYKPDVTGDQGLRIQIGALFLHIASETYLYAVLALVRQSLDKARYPKYSTHNTDSSPELI